MLKRSIAGAGIVRGALCAAADPASDNDHPTDVLAD
jgi:hypothetical protein